jgi:thiamine-monophosphate kinase
MISITAFGRVPSDRMVKRSGAQAGDHLVVTGTVGDAALGLDILKGGAVAQALGADAAAAREALVGRYRVPQPRVALAQAVRDHAGAAMDVSDGLMGDLAKLCAASGVGATVEAASIPLSASTKQLIDRGFVSLETIVSGGDDYEILCAIPGNRLESFRKAAAGARIPVAVIGEITAGSSRPRLVDQGREVVLSRLSYSHF